jgi:hypothetical protein
MGNLKMKETDKIKLTSLLDKAEKILCQYSGGYSKDFFSAEEFHIALIDSINCLRNGDNSQIEKLFIWFMPTSCWDDFVGTEGLDLGNEIFEILNNYRKSGIHLLTVEETFLILGKYLVLTPGIGDKIKYVKSGSKIKLILPDKSIVFTKVLSITSSGNFNIAISPHFLKEDILQGTEVWTDE